MAYPKDFHPTKDWVSAPIEISATGTTNIPVPRGYFIDRMTLEQGGTNLGSSATLVAQLPEDNNSTITIFDANGNGCYSPSAPITLSGSSAFAGTAAPYQLYTNDGVNIVADGTIAANGTATVTLYATSCSPSFPFLQQHRPSKQWISDIITLTHTTADIGATVNAPVPKGYVIDRIRFIQGSTALTANIGLTASLPEAADKTIITFDSDGTSQYYIPTMLYTGAVATEISSNLGRPIRMYTDQGINFTTASHGDITTAMAPRFIVTASNTYSRYLS